MDNYFFGLPPRTKQRVGLKLFYPLLQVLNMPEGITKLAKILDISGNYTGLIAQSTD